MSSNRNLLFVLLAVIAIGLPVRADDWFVDNVGGVDNLLSYRQGRDLQSIQFALRHAQPGDRIILKKNDEPYREEISIQGSGMMGKPLEIIGNGATLEGAESIAGVPWDYVGNDVFRWMPKRISHQRVYLNGRPATKVESAGTVAALQPLEWTQHQGWIYFRVESGAIPAHYDLACCSKTVGITLYQVRNIRISDLTVQGFQFDAINAHDLVENARVEGCTFRGNGRSGVSVGGASKLEVLGCLIGDNGRSQVRSEGYCHVAIENCDIIDQPGIKPLDIKGGRVTIDGKSIQP